MLVETDGVSRVSAGCNLGNARWLYVRIYPGTFSAKARTTNLNLQEIRSPQQQGFCVAVLELVAVHPAGGAAAVAWVLCRAGVLVVVDAIGVLEHVWEIGVPHHVVPKIA